MSVRDRESGEWIRPQAGGSDLDPTLDPTSKVTQPIEMIGEKVVDPTGSDLFWKISGKSEGEGSGGKEYGNRSDPVGSTQLTHRNSGGNGLLEVGSKVGSRSGQVGSRSDPSELSKSNEWGTPDAEWARWNRRFSFTVDVAAAAWNAKCPRYYSAEDSGLEKSWRGERAWMNPPYSKGNLIKWMGKARYEAENGALVVCCVPAYTAEGWFQRHVLAPAGALRTSSAGPGWVRWDWERLGVELHMLPGRQHFREKSGATGPARHSTVIVVFEGLLCQRPGCGQVLRQPPGAGRRKRWCSAACRQWGKRTEIENFGTSDKGRTEMANFGTEGVP